MSLDLEVTRLIRHPLHSISEDIRCLYSQFGNTTWFRRKGPPSPESLGRLGQSHSIFLSRAIDLGHIDTIYLMWNCTVWYLLRCTLARDKVNWKPKTEQRSKDSCTQNIEWFSANLVAICSLLWIGTSPCPALSCIQRRSTTVYLWHGCRPILSSQPSTPLNKQTHQSTTQSTNK